MTISPLATQLRVRPLVEQIADRLAKAILVGEIPLGSMLREQSLAATLGVSRGPLREAIRCLEGRQLVTRVPNYGPRVISLEPSDIGEIYTVREALEGIACRCAAELMTDVQIKQLTKLVEVQQKNRSINKHNFDSDLDFHDKIIKAAKNDRLAAIVMGELYYLLKIYRRISEIAPARDEQALEEHREIVNAISKRDPELAESLMRQHVRNSRDNLLKFAKLSGRRKTEPLRMVDGVPVAEQKPLQRSPARRPRN